MKTLFAIHSCFVVFMSIVKRLQVRIYGLTSQSFNPLVYAFTFALIFWSGLFFLKISSAIPAIKISNIAAQSEFLIHFFTLLTIFPLYTKATLEDRKILKWFLIANICLFLNDLAFYMAAGSFIKINNISFAVGLVKRTLLKIEWLYGLLAHQFLAFCCFF